MEENSESENANIPTETTSETSHKKRNDWKTFSGILGLVIIALLVVMFYGRITGNVVSESTAGDNVLKFAQSQGVNATVVEINKQGDLYEVVLSMQGQEVPVYVTKDGKKMATGLIPLTADVVDNTDTTDTTQQKDVPKSDKPKVELFVMTYCPYGTQAEKGIIPAINALGSKIDAKIRFVHYFMHGDQEEKETYTQVCIREEQSSKYLNYLSCFLEDGNSTRCLTKTAIDKTKLNACLANDNKKAKEYYKVDSDLSNKYGVQGSPTLIINRVESSAGRDSVSYLKGICSAFNTAPATECAKQLSSASPSPGFGTTAAASGSTDASCG